MKQQSKTLTKNVCKIILIRHGESVNNRQNIVAGDSPLTAKGKQQAIQAREKLKSFKFDEVYSSDMVRAIQTAELVSGKAVPKMNQLSQLRERSFGSLDGKPGELYDEDHKKRLTLNAHENWHYKHVPDMESDHEVSARVLKCLTTVAQRNMGKTILVAAHGAVMRTILMSLNNLSYHHLPGGSLANAGYIELDYHDNQFSVANVVGANFGQSEFSS